jgi:hypothetical protein
MTFVAGGWIKQTKQILTGTNKTSKSKIQGFFPFDFAQGQNDDVGTNNCNCNSRSLRDDKQRNRQQQQQQQQEPQQQQLQRQELAGRESTLPLIAMRPR